MRIDADMGALARRAAEQFGTAIAVAVPGGRTLSFAEIDDLAGRFATSLARRGVGRGDRVLLHLPNGWQWIVCYHAIARIGAVVVPANILLSAAELRFMAGHAGVSASILPPDKAAPLQDISAVVIAISDHHDDRAFGAMLDAQSRAPILADPCDLFTIGYTSGTTGRPKGAMLTHSNVFACIALTATIHVRTSADRVYSALPFPHVYGNVVMNTCFLTGARLVAPARFEPGEALAAIERDRITLFEGVPTMYYQMLGQPSIDIADLSSLTRCTVGGQTMPASRIDAVIARFVCPLLELWGMTEVAGPAVSHSPYWPARGGSIGLPFPGIEARIVDRERLEDRCPAGTRGELMIRGPLVMGGYWHDPEATAQAIDKDGWLATGDIACADADGFLFIVDRKKDMILTAGYNVYPAEVEAVIAAFPGVSMVAVAGLADDEKGEIACAFIVSERPDTIDEDALLAHCRDRLAAYKVPRRLHFVTDLPKTSTGKIMRRGLCDLLPSSLVTSA